MYVVKCENIGQSKDPFLTQVSDFAVLFGNELDAEVVLFICATASRLYLSIIHSFATSNHISLCRCYRCQWIYLSHEP